MDTLSHAVLGMAVAGLSGQPFAFDNPIYLATLLGSQAPDFDIIALFRGNLALLRQHRAFSHSIPALILWSALIATGLCIFFPQTNFALLFLWASAGALSHICADYLNTHGAAIIWPFRRERKSLHLLNVFDPLLLILMLSPYIFKLPAVTFSQLSFTIFAIYIFLRLYLRWRSRKWLLDCFRGDNICRLLIMPSLKRVFFWDFVLETESRHYVGQIGALYPSLKIKADLPRQPHHSKITEKAQKTTLGNFFCTFSPYVYFEEERYLDSFKVNIYDLRYFLNKEFIHRATITFDDGKAPTTAYLYSEGRTIKVPC